MDMQPWIRPRLTEGGRALRGDPQFHLDTLWSCVHSERPDRFPFCKRIQRVSQLREERRKGERRGRRNVRRTLVSLPERRRGNLWWLQEESPSLHSHLSHFLVVCHISQPPGFFIFSRRRRRRRRSVTCNHFHHFVRTPRRFSTKKQNMCIYKFATFQEIKKDLKTFF